MAKALEQLKSVVSRLRSPKGCPWDRKQTHESLIPYLREESAELAEALKGGRWHEMEDELGDILFHVILHAKIAEEKGGEADAPPSARFRSRPEVRDGR